jgi:hypothetical protein
MNENRVLNIKLPVMALQGSFPNEFEYCGRMIRLNILKTLYQESYL